MTVQTDFESIRIRVRKEMELNDPPIEPGQFWICHNSKGEVFRKLKIIAEYPRELGMERFWIVEEHAAKLRNGRLGELSKCPEFNLRYVFRPEDGTDGT